MRREDLKPFLSHIEFDNDFEDFEYDYSGGERKVRSIKCRILDGPFAGKTATIEVGEK